MKVLAVAVGRTYRAIVIDHDTRQTSVLTEGGKLTLSGVSSGTIQRAARHREARRFATYAAIRSIHSGATRAMHYDVPGGM